ncbi:MAG: hypothetical protein WD401_03010 [Thermomicrobiaceae bacterium]
MQLSEQQARKIAEEAVEQAGGSRQIYGNPRHPYARNATRTYEIQGRRVVLRIGESSAPAIVEVETFVYEIQPEGLMKLFGPDD